MFTSLSLLQYVGWYDDPGVSGIEGSLEGTLKADPEFGKSDFCLTA